MKNFLKKNYIYIILILVTLITLGLSVLFHFKEKEFVSSIFSNLFAGTVTGCVIAFISALKNRNKINLIIMKDTYNRLFDFNFEFLEYNSNLSEIEDKEIFWNNAYEKLSKFNFTNEYIMKMSNEIYNKEEFENIFANQFDYDAIALKKICKEIRDNIENLKNKNDREKILKEIRNLEINILMLNIKLKKEINRYDKDIYKIEQFFI